MHTQKKLKFWLQRSISKAGKPLTANLDKNMVIDPSGPSQNKGSIINSTSGSKSRAVSSTPSSVPAAPKPGPSLADSVSLSSRAQTLVKLEGKITQAPDVDRQKVESIKQSIAEGRYTIDPHKIAAAILAEDDNNP